MSFLATTLLLLCLLGAVLSQQAEQVVQDGGGCVVEFVIDPERSAVSLRADVVKPLPVSFATSNEQYVKQGIQGSFFVSLGEGNCSDVVPTGADLLEELGKGVTLRSRLPDGYMGPAQEMNETELIDFYPYNITFIAATVGTVVNLWDLGFEMSLALLAGSGAGTTPDETLSGELNSISRSGEVFTTSLIVPQGESFPFGEHSSTNTALVSARVNGSVVELDVTNFNVTMGVPYASEANPGFESLAYYRLVGNVVLRGVAGCNLQDCGPHGRCAPSSDGEAVCQCNCGWSGPLCDISSGYCPEYEGDFEQRGEQCPAAKVAPSPPPSAPPPCTRVDGQRACSPLFETQGADGACVCKEGFTGPQCESCETDAACASLYDSGIASCGTSAVYSRETVFKAYTCDLEGTGLESTIVPGTFFVVCNTTSPGPGDAVTDGAYCAVNFALQDQADNPITCKTSLCAFVADSSQVNCRDTSCTCERECPNLDGVFSSIEGMPSVIDCDETNVCTFDIQNFFVKLISPCTTAECRVKGSNFQDGSYQVEKNVWLDPVIAAIPLIILVGIDFALFVFLIRHRNLYFSRGTASTTMGSSLPMAEVTPAVVMVPPQLATPRSLSFRNLTVSLSGESPRVVLDGVCGEAHAGQVTGIMGPSGSGKTTMISFLSQRLGKSKMKGSGSVMLGNRRLRDSHTKIIGYCPQDSHLLPTLTVYETIMYSAILRLPRDTDVRKIHRVTEESISVVRLDGVKSSYVGGTGRIRGISGGERRRVSVAMELVTSPKIVLLDEPTSGLDSSSAKQVISALKSLSNTGCIVMLSLHQPSPSIFHMLDRVFLLAQGRCLYNGQPADVEPFLNGMGLPMPPGGSIAEFMLECASDAHAVEQLMANLVPRGSTEKLTEEDIEYETDVEDAKDVKDKECDHASADPATSSVPTHNGASIVTELATLTWRNGIDMIRNPTLILLHWLLALGMGIFAGCVFFQVGLDTSGAQNRAGGLIFALAFFAFTSLTTVDIVFHEKSIVSREVDGGYYRRWTYVISKLVLDGLFLRFLPILIFSAPFYPMMGLDSDPSSVALFLMTLGTFAIAVGALSLAVTFSSGTAGQASFIMNIILLVCLLNSGFFVNAENMPDWISWLRYLSVFFYGYSVLITNEVSDLLFQFVVEGYTAVENVRGITFLNILGINPSETTNYIIILDCMYAIFCLACLGLSLLGDRIKR